MIFFNIHTHKPSHQTEVLEIVNQYPQEFDSSLSNYSIGIHPWYIVEDRIESDLQVIGNKLQENNCLAIGECGLDKRVATSMTLQLMVFEKQLALAEKFQKPVILHCVAAFQELIAIKKKLKLTVPMIIHGFSKNIEVANQLVQNSIPNDRLFLETDTIEQDIREVYELAAKYKNIEVEEMKAIIKTNFNTVFNRINKK
jgi:TatD DNase family protein